MSFRRSDLTGIPVEFWPLMAENLVEWHPTKANTLIARDSLSLRAWLEHELLLEDMAKGFPPRK